MMSKDKWFVVRKPSEMIATSANQIVALKFQWRYKIVLSLSFWSGLGTRLIQCQYNSGYKTQTLQRCLTSGLN